MNSHANDLLCLSPLCACCHGFVDLLFIWLDASSVDTLCLCFEFDSAMDISCLLPDGKPTNRTADGIAEKMSCADRSKTCEAQGHWKKRNREISRNMCPSKDTHGHPPFVDACGRWCDAQQRIRDVDKTSRIVVGENGKDGANQKSRHVTGKALTTAWTRPTGEPDPRSSSTVPRQGRCGRLLHPSRFLDCEPLEQHYVHFLPAFFKAEVLGFAIFVGLVRLADSHIRASQMCVVEAGHIRIWHKVRLA